MYRVIQKLDKFSKSGNIHLEFKIEQILKLRK